MGLLPERLWKRVSRRRKHCRSQLSTLPGFCSRKRLGLHCPWKRADFVLVEGNPAEQINDIRRCRRVMKNGVLDKSADLYLAVGMKPADKLDLPRPISDVETGFRCSSHMPVAQKSCAGGGARGYGLLLGASSQMPAYHA